MVNAASLIREKYIISLKIKPASRYRHNSQLSLYTPKGVLSYAEETVEVNLVN